MRPLDYLHYNKKEATNFLVRNFDFQEYPQKHFESRFTKFYESYWLPERFGYDTRKVQYSSLILTQQMKRNEALENLKKKSYDKETIKNDIELLYCILSIGNDEELKVFMDMPKKSYKDYKSQENLYVVGSKISRILGLRS